jgi:hypothetical protein
MRKNWWLVSWACSEIGYSLAEHARKLVTRWLSMRENWLLASWAYEKIISVHYSTCIFRVFPLFFMSPIPLSPSLVPVERPLSPLSRLCTLFYISFSLCSINEYIGTNSTYVHILGPLCKLAKSLQGVGRGGGNGSFVFLAKSPCRHKHRTY